MNLLLNPNPPLQGEISVPGDKSLSHRTVILSALAEGNSTIHGFLTGKDCLATVEAMCHLGVKIDFLDPETLLVHGVGLHGLQAPKQSIDCGNSGTSMRLLAGILAAQPFTSVLKGDDSLQQRPMERIVLPLQQMGARIVGREVSGRIFSPLEIHGNTSLSAIDYEMPIASAQVKSCLLLAGLYAKGQTSLKEKGASRDHTERLLQSFGVALSIAQNHIILTSPTTLKAQEIYIPGDISSAAFFIAGAAMVPGSHIILRQVGVNPRRIGIISILKLMGADITIHGPRLICGEPIADIEIKGTKLRGIDVPSEMVVSAIDEFPIIFIAASCASGTTHIRGIEELRYKETDRIEVMAKGLKILGVSLEVFPDGILINGSSLNEGTVVSHGDHRVAMAFAMASLVAKGSIIIRDCDNIATSFPNFCELANQLGMSIHSIED